MLLGAEPAHVGHIPVDGPPQWGEKTKSTKRTGGLTEVNPWPPSWCLELTSLEFLAHHRLTTQSVANNQTASTKSGSCTDRLRKECCCLAAAELNSYKDVHDWARSQQEGSPGGIAAADAEGSPHPSLLREQLEIICGHQVHHITISQNEHVRFTLFPKPECFYHRRIFVWKICTKAYVGRDTECPNGWGMMLTKTLLYVGWARTRPVEQENL